MSLYRLHYFPESGNSYKLALMLTLCGQTFEPVWTDFGSRVTWTAEWRAAVAWGLELNRLQPSARSPSTGRCDRLGARSEWRADAAAFDRSAHDVLDLVPGTPEVGSEQSAAEVLISSLRP